MATGIGVEQIYGVSINEIDKQLRDIVLTLMNHCSENGNSWYCVNLGWINAVVFFCPKRRGLCMLRIYSGNVKVWAKVAVTPEGKLEVVDVGFVD